MLVSRELSRTSRVNLESMQNSFLIKLSLWIHIEYKWECCNLNSYVDNCSKKFNFIYKLRHQARIYDPQLPIYMLGHKILQILNISLLYNNDLKPIQKYLNYVLSIKLMKYLDCNFEIIKLISTKNCNYQKIHNYIIFRLNLKLLFHSRLQRYFTKKKKI